jgi:hypothetical protein
MAGEVKGEDIESDAAELVAKIAEHATKMATSMPTKKSKSVIPGPSNLAGGADNVLVLIIFLA